MEPWPWGHWVFQVLFLPWRWGSSTQILILVQIPLQALCHLMKHLSRFQHTAEMFLACSTFRSSLTGPAHRLWGPAWKRLGSLSVLTAGFPSYRAQAERGSRAAEKILHLDEAPSACNTHWAFFYHCHQQYWQLFNSGTTETAMYAKTEMKIIIIASNPENNHFHLLSRCCHRIALKCHPAPRSRVMHAPCSSPTLPESHTASSPSQSLYARHA